MGSRFPSMLKNEARIIGSLTRSDLMIIGVLYLTMSFILKGGIEVVLFISIFLFIFKKVSKKVNRGFLKELNEPQALSWSYKISEAKNEK